MQQQPNSKRVLTFTEHLEELRVRIIIVLTSFVVFLVLGFFVAHHALGWLIAPLTKVRPTTQGQTLTFRLNSDGSLWLTSPKLPAESAQDPELFTKALAQVSPDRIAIELTSGTQVLVGARTNSQLFFLSPLEPFFLLLKGALFLSCFFCVPLAIYQTWLFVAPGLTRKERRAVKPILLSSFVLFPLGALFAYFVSHVALNVLIGFSDSIAGLQPNIVASEYLSFILKLMLVFGLFFEFPLVLVLLSRMGIIDSTFLMQKRRYAILIIAVLAAVFTPPDPFSMIVAVLPMLLLYEIAIWVIRALERADLADTSQAAESGEAEKES